MMRHSIEAQRMNMDACPADKVMSRLIRNIKRHGLWEFYEGYSINRPNVGDTLVHLCSPRGGRHSIKIDAGGRITWAYGMTVFIPEMFEAE